jgi:hypothetical protein
MVVTNEFDVAPEVVLSAESAWESAAGAGSPLIVQEQKSVIQAIVDLKAYCIGARIVLENMDIKNGKLKNGAMQLVSAFGHQNNKEIIGEYATIIGELKAKHPIHPGMAGYLTDTANENVLKGNGLTMIGESGSLKNFVFFDAKSFGLRSTPAYFHKLKIQLSDFIAIRGKLHEGKGGQAIKSWIDSGKSDVYKSFYAKITAKYMGLAQAQDLLEAEGAEVAEHASFNAGLKKGTKKDIIVVPLPVAGAEGAQKVRDVKTFKMPTEHAIKREAMQETMKYLKKLTLQEQSPAAVVENIEAIMQGVTVKMTTSSRMFADSSQTPQVKIVGALGTIKAHLDALPLQGDHIEQHFVAKSKKTIGVVSHVILTSDPGVKNNPWLCSKFEIQVGAGNPWVQFAPEGKTSQLGVAGKTDSAKQNEYFKQDGFWLDASEGKHGPYYRLVTQKEYLLLPTSQAMIYTKKFNKKVPLCPNIHTGDGGCFDGKRSDLEKQCNAHPKCQGFSYTHGDGKSKNGRGCLKYRCEQVTDDGKLFQEGDTKDYWTKQAFVYKTSPPTDVCTTTCGFGGDIKYGKVFCTQIVDGKKVSDDKCDFWHPRLLRPKRPTKKCPATNPCTQWRVIQAPQCRTLQCSQAAYTQSAQAQCHQTKDGRHVADSACLFWKQSKPSPHTRYCAAARPCTRWVAGGAPGCPGKSCGQGANTETGQVYCSIAQTGQRVGDNECQYWHHPRPAPQSRYCPGGGRCCGQRGKCANDCCTYVARWAAPTNSCANCPFGNHHVWPGQCGSSRRCDGSRL